MFKSTKVSTDLEFTSFCNQFQWPYTNLSCSTLYNYKPHKASKELRSLFVIETSFVILFHSLINQARLNKK